MSKISSGLRGNNQLHFSPFSSFISGLTIETKDGQRVFIGSQLLESRLNKEKSSLILIFSTAIVEVLGIKLDVVMDGLEGGVKIENDNMRLSYITSREDVLDENKIIRSLTVRSKLMDLDETEILTSDLSLPEPEDDGWNDNPQPNG